MSFGALLRSDSKIVLCWEKVLSGQNLFLDEYSVVLNCTRKMAAKTYTQNLVLNMEHGSSMGTTLETLSWCWECDCVCNTSDLWCRW